MGVENTKLMLETFQTHLNLEIESRFWGLLTTFPSVILVNQFRADFGAPPLRKQPQLPKLGGYVGQVPIIYPSDL